ncbi:MAG: hypothetical protein U0271_22970 [Polyangiaceae bacterium]
MMPFFRLRRRALATFAAVGVLQLGLWVAPSAVRADQDTATQAQALYDRAVELMNQKQYAEACSKLEEVTRLVPDGLGAKLTLAECYEADGRIASAWTEYALLEQLAARAKQPERERIGHDRAAKLKSLLAHVKIVVPPSVAALPGLKIKLAGVEVSPSLFNEPVPVDKGSHPVEVTADSKKSWTGTVEVAQDGVETSINVPELETVETKTPTATTDTGWLIPAGAAIGGVGVAAAIVGGVMGGLAIGKNSDAETACPGGFCNAEGNDLRREAGLFADVSTGLLVGGGVLAAAGIVMLAVAPWGGGDSAEKAATPRLSVGLGFVSFTASFQ